ncbi:hypothetical protein E2C01_102559 [Portunus trituberculatus]|uniref:Uncharacterized protein n=1 Tax=Portunus trituberculatus TaxID=210409 RepID=A0A5B7KIM6_PORTR|nr:hypothetical protein [Portunus trituberculatus]
MRSHTAATQERQVGRRTYLTSPSSER